MATLDELLLRSRELNAELSQNTLESTLNNTIPSKSGHGAQQTIKAAAPILTTTLPKIDRDLSQVLEASTRLWESLGKPNNFTDEQKAKAALVMNKKDTNFILPSMNPNLQGLLKNKNLQPLEPCKDLEQLLSNERENMILNLIDGGEKTADELVFNSTVEGTLNKWAADKMSLAQQFSQGSSGDYSVLKPDKSHSNSFFSTSFTNSMNITDKFSSSFNRSPRGKFSSYASINPLEKAFATILKENILGDFLASVLAEKEKLSVISRRLESGATGDDNIIELWDVLDHILNNSKSVDNKNLKVKAIHGAGIDYLETRFRKFVEVEVKRNQQILNTNKSLPTTAELVAAYTSIVEKRSRYSMNPLDSENAKVYFSLRMGDVDTAIEFAGEPLSSAIADWRGSSLGGGGSNSNSAGGGGGPGSAGCTHLFISKTSQKLSSRFERELSLEYKKTSKSMPYYAAVLAILGCGNVHDDHSQVTSSAECWLWMSMHQISEFSTIGATASSSTKNKNPNKLNVINDTSTTTFSQNAKQPFSAFQNTLVTSPEGTAILDSFTDKPITYIKLLILTQQFGLALDILLKLGENLGRIHAPHLAICLKNSKVLTENSWNFGKNIINYCLKWQSTNPEFAIYYFFYLNDLPDSGSLNGKFNSESTLFHESVSRLIFDGISDNIFEFLFNRTNGQIYKLLSIQEANTLFSKVAKDCEKHGRLEQACKLFEIAGEYNHCVNLLIDGMANGNANLLKVSQEITERVGIEVLGNSVDNVSTLLLVMDMTQLLEKLSTAEKLPLKQTKMIDIASYEIVSMLNIIPLKNQSVDSCSELFRVKPETVRAAFPNLLVAIMKLYVRLSNTAPECKLTLKEAASALVMFSGRVTYRTSASINAQLVHLQLSV